MSVRVWNSETYVDYPDAADYLIGSAYELNVRDAGGQQLATYPPGNWHHVERPTAVPTPE